MMPSKSSVSAVPHIYSPYDPPPDAGVDCSVLPSMTQQSFKDECDINAIMKRFEATGFIDVSSRDGGLFADVSSLGDYQAAQNLVIAANEAFMDLPVKVRKRFGNDPVVFLSFVDSLNSGDEATLAEARALGLLKPTEPLNQSARAASAPPPEAGGGAAPKAADGVPIAK